MNVNCLKCGKPMRLLREAVSNYGWQCPDQCLAPVDTGVPTSESLAPLERAVLAGQESTSSHSVDSLSNELTLAVCRLVLSGSPVFTKPLPPNYVAGARVYAPHILTHFVECTRGGCYNSIFQNFLVPHFDSAAALDYVLRTSVVRGDIVLEAGIPAPRMYPELLSRLCGVRSPNIQQYLAQRFGT
jgi:hypothetical protein